MNRLVLVLVSLIVVYFTLIQVSFASQVSSTSSSDSLLNVTLSGPNGENLAIVTSVIVLQNYVYAGFTLSGNSGQPYPFVYKFDLNLNQIGFVNLTDNFPASNSVLLIGIPSTNQVYAFNRGIVQIDGSSLKVVKSVSWGDREALVAWASPDYSMFFTATEDSPLPHLFVVNVNTLEFTSNSTLDHLGNFGLNYFQCLPSYTQKNVSYCSGLNLHFTSAALATYKISSSLEWLDDSDVNGGSIISAPSSYSGKEDLWTVFSSEETLVSGFSDSLRLEWNVTLEGTASAGIITNGKYLYVATSNINVNPSPTTVFALNPSNGDIEQQWEFAAGFTPVFSGVGQPLPFASSGTNNYLFVFSSPLQQSFPSVLTRITQN